jgi:transcriptional regulator with XRE-family HTH domain
MPRTRRAEPRALVAGWPDGEARNPVADMARRFAVNLKEAIGTQSIRKVAVSLGLNHSTLIAIMNGQTWPDLETIAKIEIGLDRDVWPGRREEAAAPPAEGVDHAGKT